MILFAGDLPVCDSFTFTEADIREGRAIWRAKYKHSPGMDKRHVGQHDGRDNRGADGILAELAFSKLTGCRMSKGPRMQNEWFDFVLPHGSTVDVKHVGRPDWPLMMDTNRFARLVADRDAGIRVADFYILFLHPVASVPNRTMTVAGWATARTFYGGHIERAGRFPVDNKVIPQDDFADRSNPGTGERIVSLLHADAVFRTHGEFKMSEQPTVEDRIAGTDAARLQHAFRIYAHIIEHCGGIHDKNVAIDKLLAVARTTVTPSDIEPVGFLAVQDILEQLSESNWTQERYNAAFERYAAKVAANAVSSHDTQA